MCLYLHFSFLLEMLCFVFQDHKRISLACECSRPLEVISSEGSRRHTAGALFPEPASLAANQVPPMVFQCVIISIVPTSSLGLRVTEE